MNNTNQTPIVIAIVGLVLITLGVLFFRTDSVKETVSTDRTIETVKPSDVEAMPAAPVEPQGEVMQESGASSSESSVEE